MLTSLRKTLPILDSRRGKAFIVAYVIDEMLAACAAADGDKGDETSKDEAGHMLLLMAIGRSLVIGEGCEYKL